MSTDMSSSYILLSLLDKFNMLIIDQFKQYQWRSTFVVNEINPLELLSNLYTSRQP